MSDLLRFNGDNDSSATDIAPPGWPGIELYTVPFLDLLSFIWQLAVLIKLHLQKAYLATTGIPDTERLVS